MTVLTRPCGWSSEFLRGLYPGVGTAERSAHICTPNFSKHFQTVAFQCDQTGPTPICAESINILGDLKCF